MVNISNNTCPICGGKLRHRDHTKRIVRTKGGKTDRISIQRLICEDCGVIHRELPDYLYPYKHYEAKIIESVIMGKIDIYDLDFEDYPSEMTMKRWIKSQKQTNTLI